MPEIKIYCPQMQADVEAFYARCFAGLGWEFQPRGRHRDIYDIPAAYMKDGCFWCLYEGGELIGTVALYTFTENPKTAEIKRLYVLKECHGKGYGQLLLECALQFARDEGFERVYLDSRRERAAALGLFRKFGFVEVPQYNDNWFAQVYFKLDL